MSKSDMPADALKMSKKDPFALTLAFRFVLALTHCCLLVVALYKLKSAEASRFKNTLVETVPPSADSPMSTSGMRWLVALNGAHVSGLAEIVTLPSVLRFQVKLILIWAGQHGDETKTRLTLGVWRKSI